MFSVGLRMGTQKRRSEEGITAPDAADGSREHTSPSLTAHSQSLHLSRVLLILFVFMCMPYDVHCGVMDTCHSMCVRSEGTVQDSVLSLQAQELNSGSGLHSKETL